MLLICNATGDCIEVGHNDISFAHDVTGVLVEEEGKVFKLELLRFCLDFLNLSFNMS